MTDPESQDEPTTARHTAMMLEKIYGEFRVFGDGLTFVRDHIARMAPQMDRMTEDIALLKVAVRVNTKDIAVIKKDVAVLKKDVAVLKRDVKEIKTNLKSHDRRLATLESRPS